MSQAHEESEKKKIYRLQSRVGTFSTEASSVSRSDSGLKSRVDSFPTETSSVSRSDSDLKAEGKNFERSKNDKLRSQEQGIKQVGDGDLYKSSITLLQEKHERQGRSPTTAKILAHVSIRLKHGLTKNAVAKSLSQKSNNRVTGGDNASNSPVRGSEKAISDNQKRFESFGVPKEEHEFIGAKAEVNVPASSINRGYGRVLNQQMIRDDRPQAEAKRSPNATEGSTTRLKPEGQVRDALEAPVRRPSPTLQRVAEREKRPLLDERPQRGHMR